MAIGHVEELVSSAKLTDDLERDIDVMATRLWNLEYMDLVCAVGTLAAALVLLRKRQSQLSLESKKTQMTKFGILKGQI